LILQVVKYVNGRIIISTYPDLKSAEKAAEYLIHEKRLAACVNLVKIESRYIWKDKYEESGEYLAIYKTTQEKMNDLKKEVEAQHPFNTPEVIEIAVFDMNKKYLDWLNNVTGSF
jgi:periplasmic divalent cation tolerance protein|tara:strand:+ start:5047 stop:5391 length:345 start_codon:yes stop_codon:yes gene_type:complete